MAIVGAHASGQYLGLSAVYFEDLTRQWRLEDFLDDTKSPSWERSNEEILNLGISDAAYWVKTSIKSSIDRDRTLYIEVPFPLLDSIKVYFVKGKMVYKEYETGDILPFQSREIDHRNFVFPFDIGANETIDVYFRMDNQGSTILPMRLWSPKDFAERSGREGFGLGLYYGSIGVLLLYNLFLYTSLRKRSYLYYVFYIATYGTFIFSLNGLSFQYIWPQSPELNKFIVLSLIAGASGTLSLFTESFLNLKTRAPWLSYLMRGIKYWSFLGIFFPFVFSYYTATRLLASLPPIVITAAIISSIQCYRKGFPPARFFFIAFFSFMLGIILYALKAGGILPSNFITEYSMQIGSALEIVLLSLALGDRIHYNQSRWRKEIETLNKSLIEKEESRTTFFHNTSHELRTPLNGILSFLSLILREQYGGINERVRSQLLKIENLSRSLMNQVNTILDLAKSRSGELKARYSLISLKDLTKEVRYLSEGLLIKKENVTLEINDNWQENDQPVFIGDKEKVTAIVRNLVGNAVKFTPNVPGNNISITLEITTNRALSIRVRDSGIGIAVEDQSRIFEEFQQVESNSRRHYEGTGLGLAIVKQICNLLGGDIWLESKLDNGSTFCVTIPEGEQVDTAHAVQPEKILRSEISAATEAKTKVLQVKPKPEPDISKSYHVMVVDDNEVNCEVIKDIVEMHGHTATVFSSSKEALDSVMRVDPDIILLDLMMPELSGEDFLKAIKADSNLSNIPIILLTARASEEDRLEGLSLGADDYLAKPIVIDELMLRINYTLSRLNFAKAKVEKRLIETTLAAAQEVHSSLGEVSLQVPNISTAVFYQSAELTSGDWLGMNYDDLNHRLYIFVGDVTGHGTTSAFITIAASAALKGALTTIKSLGKTLTQRQCLHYLAHATNAAVKDAGGKIEKYMTMVFCCLDLQTGALDFINAGHTPFFHATDDMTKTILVPGSPLGTDTDPHFGEGRFDMSCNDSILFYTDGLLENTGNEGQTITDKSIKKIFAKQKSVDQVKDEIQQLMSKTWHQRKLEDDCTFIVIKWDQSLANQLAG